MKNLIFQYYDGDLISGIKAGSIRMKEYADRIGADYLFEHNPRYVNNLGKYSPHYGQFKVVYEEKFHKYDNILFTDTDVFPLDGLTENIFDGFTADIGICTEPFQPKHRASITGHISGANDEKWVKVIKDKWNVNMPRTNEGLLKVYNSGVVMYSNKGLKKARENFVPFREYVDLININRLSTFYTADQNYLHSMLKVADMDYVELNSGWNSYVHYLGNGKMKVRPVNDMRTKDTKFVHIQLSSADHYDIKKLWRITNLPVKEWNL